MRAFDVDAVVVGVDRDHARAGQDKTSSRSSPTPPLLSYFTASVIRLGDLLDFGQLLKHLATINLPKSLTFQGNFCKGVKSYHFSREIIFGHLLSIFGNFFWSHCSQPTFLYRKIRRHGARILAPLSANLSLLDTRLG